MIDTQAVAWHKKATRPDHPTTRPDGRAITSFAPQALLWKHKIMLRRLKTDVLPELPSKVHNVFYFDDPKVRDGARERVTVLIVMLVLTMTGGCGREVASTRVARR